MKIAVLTATMRYGGLDVTYEALSRQTHDDFVWIVCDKLYEERKEEFWRRTSSAHFGITYMSEPPRPEGYYSNLPAIYNHMISVALEHHAELAVSLQDYITINRNGLAQFALAQEEHPGALVAGLCSMLRHPVASAVADPKGLWTVFASPWAFQDLTTDLEWVDVRGHLFRFPPALHQTYPGAWEMNWGSFPLPAPATFDETFGEHLGHENVEFALACKEAGAEILIQPLNHSLSLPHRHYFAEEWEESQPHRAENLLRWRSEYGRIDLEV